MLRARGVDIVPPRYATCHAPVVGTLPDEDNAMALGDVPRLSGICEKQPGLKDWAYVLGITLTRGELRHDHLAAFEGKAESSSRGQGSTLE